MDEGKDGDTNVVKNVATSHATSPSRDGLDGSRRGMTSEKSASARNAGNSSGIGHGTSSSNAGSSGFGNNKRTRKFPGKNAGGDEFESLRQFLRAEKCMNLLPKFQEGGVTYDQASKMSRKDLEGLGLSRGVTMKLWKGLRKMDGSNNNDEEEVHKHEDESSSTTKEDVDEGDLDNVELRKEIEEFILSEIAAAKTKGVHLKALSEAINASKLSSEHQKYIDSQGGLKRFCLKSDALFLKNFLVFVNYKSKFRTESGDNEGQHTNINSNNRPSFASKVAGNVGNQNNTYGNGNNRGSPQRRGGKNDYGMGERHHPEYVIMRKVREFENGIILQQLERSINWIRDYQQRYGELDRFILERPHKFAFENGFVFLPSPSTSTTGDDNERSTSIDQQQLHEAEYDEDTGNFDDDFNNNDHDDGEDDGLSESNVPPDLVLVANNVSPQITLHDLCDYFQEFGTVQRIKWNNTRDRHLSTGSTGSSSRMHNNSNNIINGKSVTIEMTGNPQSLSELSAFGEHLIKGKAVSVKTIHKAPITPQPIGGSTLTRDASISGGSLDDHIASVRGKMTTGLIICLVGISSIPQRKIVRALKPYGAFGMTQTRQHLAFVHMPTEEAGHRAIKEITEIDGRRIKVGLAARQSGTPAVWFDEFVDDDTTDDHESADGQSGHGSPISHDVGGRLDQDDKLSEDSFAREPYAYRNNASYQRLPRRDYHQPQHNNPPYQHHQQQQQYHHHGPPPPPSQQQQQQQQQQYNYRRVDYNHAQGINRPGGVSLLRPDAGRRDFGNNYNNSPNNNRLADLPDDVRAKFAHGGPNHFQQQQQQQQYHHHQSPMRHGMMGGGLMHQPRPQYHHQHQYHHQNNNFHHQPPPPRSYHGQQFRNSMNPNANANVENVKQQEQEEVKKVEEAHAVEDQGQEKEHGKGKEEPKQPLAPTPVEQPNQPKQWGPSWAEKIEKDTAKMNLVNLNAAKTSSLVSLTPLRSLTSTKLKPAQASAFKLQVQAKEATQEDQQQEEVEVEAQQVADLPTKQEQAQESNSFRASLLKTSSSNTVAQNRSSPHGRPAYQYNNHNNSHHHHYQQQHFHHNNRGGPNNMMNAGPRQSSMMMRPPMNALGGPSPQYRSFNNNPPAFRGPPQGPALANIRVAVAGSGQKFTVDIDVNRSTVLDFKFHVVDEGLLDNYDIVRREGVDCLHLLFMGEELEDDDLILAHARIRNGCFVQLIINFSDID